MLMLFLCMFFLIFTGMALISLIPGNPADIHILKINQLILSVFTLLLPPIICSYFWYDKPLKSYSLHRLPELKQVILAIILIFSISPFINLLAYINEQMVLPEFLSGLENQIREMEDNAAELTRQMLDVNSTSALLLNLLVMAVIPALGEELFCRGALQNIFRKNLINIQQFGLWLSFLASFIFRCMDFYREWCSAQCWDICWFGRGVCGCRFWCIS